MIDGVQKTYSISTTDFQTECHRKADSDQILSLLIQCTDIASRLLALVFIHLFKNNQRQ